MNRGMILGVEIACHLSGMACAVYAAASICVLSLPMLVVIALATAASLAVSLEMLHFHLNIGARLFDRDEARQFINTRALYTAINLVTQAAYLAICGFSIGFIYSVIKYQLMFIITAICCNAGSLRRLHYAYSIDMTCFRVSVEALTREPIDVMQRLVKAIGAKKHEDGFPKVILGSERSSDAPDGVDRKGISRHLVQELFRNLFNPDHSDATLPAVRGEAQLIMPRCPNGLEQTYQQLGELLGYCYVHERPIGPIFSDRFLQMLLLPQVADLDMSAASLGRLMLRLLPEYSLFGRMLSADVPAESDLDTFSSSYAEDTEICHDKERLLAFINASFPQAIECVQACRPISRGLRDVLIRHYERPLALNEEWVRLHIINSIVGMPPTPARLKAMIAWELPSTYQVRADVQATKELFLRWLAKSEHRLAEFCFAVMATRWPNNTQRLTVSISSDADRLPSAHVCMNRIYLPLVDSYDQMKHKMNLFLAHALSGTGFQLE